MSDGLDLIVMLMWAAYFHCRSAALENKLDRIIKALSEDKS